MSVRITTKTLWPAARLSVVYGVSGEARDGSKSNSAGLSQQASIIQRASHRKCKVMSRQQTLVDTDGQVMLTFVEKATGWLPYPLPGSRADKRGNHDGGGKSSGSDVSCSIGSGTKLDLDGNAATRRVCRPRQGEILGVLGAIMVQQVRLMTDRTSPQAPRNLEVEV